MDNDVGDALRAIHYIQTHFESSLRYNLNLIHVPCPLFLKPETGLQDPLNGETPVKFHNDQIGDVEIVHSLAKWKRHILGKWGFRTGHGIVTNMNAIRAQEIPDATHSIYVDQWDWELVIDKSQRSSEILHTVVNDIFKAIRLTYLTMFPALSFPHSIFFMTTQQLLDLYPNKTPKEREDAICAEKGIVFLQGIGDKLSNGEVHDKRAADYDDWSLNGDILVWAPALGQALELSSMGVRVDYETMKQQRAKLGIPLDEEHLTPYERDLKEEKIPYTIGGGIGISRLTMFIAGAKHIGEVECSVWPTNNSDNKNLLYY